MEVAHSATMDGYILQQSFNEKKLVAKEEHIPGHLAMKASFQGGMSGGLKLLMSLNDGAVWELLGPVRLGSHHRWRFRPASTALFCRLHDLHVMMLQQISRRVIHLRNGQLKIHLRLNQAQLR
jgi:hypothetical protein